MTDYYGVAYKSLPCNRLYLAQYLSAQTTFFGRVLWPVVCAPFVRKAADETGIMIMFQTLLSKESKLTCNK
jgi:hypothetical protein